MHAGVAGVVAVNRAPSGLAALPAAVTLAVLFGGALLGALRLSLQPVPGATAVDGSVWLELLADPGLRRAMVFSAAIALSATALSAALALPVAAGLRRLPVVRTAFALPVLVPHLLVAVVAVLWLGPGGLAARALGGLPVEVVRDSLGAGIVLVYVFKEVPFLVLLVLAAWDRTVEERREAATVFGAGRWQVFTTVVWPAVRAPLLLGSGIVAAFVFGAFEVPLLVGPTTPRTVATWALDATRTASLAGQARAAASLLLASGISLLLAAAAFGLARRRGD